MNCIYRTIWNPALGAWVAISEIASTVARSRSIRTATQGSAVLHVHRIPVAFSSVVGGLMWCLATPGWAQAVACTASPCKGSSIYTPDAAGLRVDWDFEDSSELHASTGAPVGGGTQTFKNTSKLHSNGADALSGAHLVFEGSSSVHLGASQALRGAQVDLQGTSTTLQLNGYDTELSSLTGSGSVRSGSMASTLTLNVAEGTSASFAGELGSGSSGEDNFAVVKAGAGQWNLTGANHTFKNGLQVLGGTLHVAHSNPNSLLGKGVIVVDNTAEQNATLSIAAGTGLNNLIEVRHGGLVLNHGTITSLGAPQDHYGDPAVRLGAAGVLRNEGTMALIHDADAGVLGQGADAVVENLAGARIKGDGGVGVGVLLARGGVLSNDGAGSLIEGSGSVVGAGVSVQGAAGNVFNTNGAMIQGRGPIGVGVQMHSGGGVFNGAGATIEGSAQSVTASSAAITLMNAGKLVGKVALGDGLAHKVTLISGGQIQAAGAGGADLDMGQHAEATLTLHANSDQLHSAAVPGNTHMAGRLIKSGVATWTLDKAINARSTTIEQGTLALQGAGHHGNGSVRLTASGTRWDISGADTAPTIASLHGVDGSSVVLGSHALTVGDSTDSTFAGRITGAGSLHKQGSGTFTLTGISDYQGGTTIQAGSLVAHAASLGPGAISNHAHLILQQAQDGVLAAALNGAGYIEKTGAGALTLSGNSSGFGGHTDVRSGSVLLVSTGQLGGSMTVAQGGLLGGVGAVGGAGLATTLQSGATLAPGMPGVSTGALRIRGDLVMQPGAQLHVAADPATNQSTQVAVDGSAQLAGGVVHVGPQGNFEVGQRYTILTAGSIQGSFDRVASNYAYLTPSLSYGAQSVQLQLVRKTSPAPAPAPTEPTPISFADLATTGNQVAVAHGVESLPFTHALFRFVENLPERAPPAVFDSLSGDGHAQISSSLKSMGALMTRTGMQHMHHNLNAGWWPGAPVAQAGGTLAASALPTSKALPAWAQLVGNWQQQDADGNAASFKQHSYGLLAGMDREVGFTGWRIGGALGVTQSLGKMAARSMESGINSYSAAVYAGKGFAMRSGQLNVMAGAVYSWHDVHTQRRIQALEQTLQADYRAHTGQLMGEVGYAMGQRGKVVIEPFAGITLGEQRTRGFTERGGFAALQAQSQRNTLAHSTVGVRWYRDMHWGNVRGNLRATLGWQYAWGDRTSKTSLAFVGGQSFAVAGTPSSRNTALLGLEAQWHIARTATLSFGYQGHIAQGQRVHAGQVQLRWAFN